MRSSTRRAIVVAAAVALVYAVALRLPGSGPWLHQRVPFGVVVIGVISGAVTALAAVGLILVYRTNRFVNFAYGSMGSLVGVQAVGLYLRHHWPYAIVVPLGVVTGMAVGALIELVVIRRFRDASRLTITVASIGLAQLLGGLELLAAKAIDFTALTGGFSVPISFSLRVGVATIRGDQVLIVSVVPLVVAGLAWFLLGTDSGVAVRGAAENPDRARLLGIPVNRLSTTVWIVAGGLASLTFVLKAPFTGVTPGVVGNGPTVLLPGLAAAVVAGMESLPVAFVAGIGLGVVEQIVRWNTTGTPSFQNVVFLAVILVALLAKRGTLSRARTGLVEAWSSAGVVRAVPDELRRLPDVWAPRAALLVVLVAAAVLVPTTWGPSAQLLAAFAVVWAMVAVSLVVLTGWGGHVSLGQFAIAGVGAVVAGDLVAKAHADLFVALVAAGAAGAATALVLGLPALRIRGLFLAVTTLAFAVALDTYAFNPDRFGRLLPTDVHRPLLWQRVDLESNYAAYLVCLALLGLAVLAARGVRTARSGRVTIATRDNGPAADAAAVPTTRAKLAAFVLAGVIAGIAGGLHVLLLHKVGQHTFDPVDSLTVLSTAVIGGLGSLTGAIGGVVLFRWLETITALGDLRPLLTGTGLLIVLWAFPGGLGGLLFAARDRWLHRVAARHGLLHDEPVATSNAVVGPATVTARPAVAPRAAPPLLECRGVDAGYGPVQILFGVDFTVDDGELVALLGTNGAGKSTLLKTVCGLIRPTAGTVRLNDRAVTGLAPEAVTRHGISLMPGGKGVFPTLTVADNLRLAGWLLRGRPEEAAAARREVAELFPILGRRAEQLAGDLSGGEQQMLALAGALLTRPRILLIDELSLGLAPAVVEQLLDVVREVHRRGTTVVVVEQSVDLALRLAERAVFLEKGEVRFEGPTADLLERPDILRSVFIAGAAAAHGDPPPVVRVTETVTPAAPPGVAPHGAPVLDCVGLTKRFGGITALDDVALRVDDGDIVGLIGHNGAGKTTLIDTICGFLTPDRGRVRLQGRDVTEWSPWRRARAGMGRSFQDALLFPTLTVTETIAVALERHLESRDPLAAALWLPASYESELAVRAQVDHLVEVLGLTRFRNRLTGELSTGTRRIVELACVLAQRPSVLLLDEPSAGVAQRETEALGPLLLRVRDQTGCSIVVVEHDMPLLRSMCNRLVALELGAVIAEGTPDEVLDHPRVIESYLGTSPQATTAQSASTVGSL